MKNNLYPLSPTGEDRGMDGALFFRFGGEVLSHLAIKKAGPEGDWVGSFSHLSTLPNSLSLSGTVEPLLREILPNSKGSREAHYQPQAYLEREKQ